MTAKGSKGAAGKGHYSGAVHDKPIGWPMAGVRGRTDFNKATKVPVVKTAVVGRYH